MAAIHYCTLITRFHIFSVGISRHYKITILLLVGSMQCFGKLLNFYSSTCDRGLREPKQTRIIAVFSNEPASLCALRCEQNSNCTAFDFTNDGGKTECMLFNTWKKSGCILSSNTSHFVKVSLDDYKITKLFDLNIRAYCFKRWIRLYICAKYVCENMQRPTDVFWMIKLKEKKNYIPKLKCTVVPAL